MTDDKCPHCGKEIIDLWDYDLQDDGDATTAECPSCDKPIKITLHTSAWYEVVDNTAKVE